MGRGSTPSALIVSKCENVDPFLGQKGHIIDQKGLKMKKIMKKGKQNGVFGPRIPVFSGIFLSGIGGEKSAE